MPKQRRQAREIAPPDPRERVSPGPSRNWLAADTLALVLVAAIGLAWLSNSLFRGFTQPVGDAAVKVLVERIITAESGGDANARNKRSTATGAGQFIDDTWLEAVRKHRRDLLLGRSDKEILELRRDPELSREIATRLVGQYAALLNKRGLPVTPGSLYLTYFAGPAGAVALLSRRRHADGRGRHHRPHQPRKTGHRQPFPEDVVGRRSQEMGRRQDARRRLARVMR